jgi:hypothetical protein
MKSEESSRWMALDQYLGQHPYVHLSLTCYRQSGGQRVWSATLFKESNHAVVARGMGDDRVSALNEMVNQLGGKKISK